MNDASQPRLADTTTKPGSAPSKLRTAIIERPALVEYWNIARRYKWSILGMALLGALAGFLKANSETPIYQASLTLLIEPKRPDRGSVEEIVSSYTNPYRFYQTQSEIIKSRAIAERIARKLNPERYPWLREPPKADWVASTVASFNDLIGQTGMKIGENKAPAGAPADPVAGLVGLIRGGIEVEGGDRSQVVKLRFQSPDPEFAAAVVNAAADAYIELSLDTRLSAIKVASNWLTRQIEDLRQKVSESEARLQIYQMRESLVDTQQLSELTSGRLASLNDEVTQAQAKVTSLEKRYGNKHPAMIAARAELAEVQERLQNEKGSAVQTQSKSFELAKLERDVATYRQLYDQFLTRFKETDLAMQYNVNDVRVIDAAEPPSTPIHPNRRQIVTRWLIVGLLGGILLAWLRDFLDNTFKGPHDVEQHLALPVIGVVPYLDTAAKKKSREGKRSRPERFYLHNKKSGFAESINHIRTSILYTNVDNPPKVIMVTSAVQSEGKTTLCTNLSLAFSQIGRTLLLDADLRKPRVAEITGLGGPGVADAVAGRAKVVDSFVRDPESPNFYVMESGTQPPNPLELLSSGKFAQLVRELRSRFDHILIDSPPVLPVSDAVVLGRLADATLMVIRSGKTHRSASMSAIKSLQNADVNLIGIALSQVVGRKMAYYYPENYYGYYGEYYGRETGLAAKT